MITTSYSYKTVQLYVNVYGQTAKQKRFGHYLLMHDIHYIHSRPALNSYATCRLVLFVSVLYFNELVLFVSILYFNGLVLFVSVLYFNL